MPTNLHLNQQADPYEYELENEKKSNNKWNQLAVIVGVVTLSVTVISLVFTVIKLTTVKKKRFSFFS